MHLGRVVCMDVCVDRRYRQEEASDDSVGYWDAFLFYESNYSL